MLHKLPEHHSQYQYQNNQLAFLNKRYSKYTNIEWGNKKYDWWYLRQVHMLVNTIKIWNNSSIQMCINVFDKLPKSQVGRCKFTGSILVSGHFVQKVPETISITLLPEPWWMTTREWSFFITIIIIEY